MRLSVAVVTILIFIVKDGFSNNLLDKFGQAGYKMKDVRMQLGDFNRKYSNDFTIKAFKYNRTTTAHNCSVIFKYELEDKMENFTYNVCNFVIDETRFSPLVPNGRYRGSIKLIYMDEDVAEVLVFCEIYTPVVIKD